MELWADLPKQGEQSDDSTELSTRLRRRLSEREMLQLWREWLLSDYVPTYGRSLGASRIFRRFYWVDALGISQVKRSQATLRSQTLHSIEEIAQNLTREERPIALSGLLLEAGSSRRKELSPEQSSALSMPKKSGILAASWLEISSTLLAGMAQSPAIFLLNPLGIKLFSADDLTAVVQRAVPTELFLLLPHKQIEYYLQLARKNPQSASLITNLLRSDRWKTLPQDKIEQQISGFIQLFKHTLQRHFQLPLQVISLPVPNGPASLEPLPQTLLFATRRTDSLFALNDALCRYQRERQKQSYEGVLGEEWFQAQAQSSLASQHNELAQRIHQQGQAQRIRRWPDLRLQLIQQHFGSFTLAEYDAILQELLLKQSIHCIWQKKSSQPDKERIPGNNDTLMWN
ncbi:hypothetical protein [Tengunoibacter tsumagoiensis]|uniref:Uncharacterized protein n=1 Tax=Tengunoibacter tsumagoiensis TaxID=2014871 RepID=A0A401ZVN4_9CHLR|nr:hypothetical protein [Tengunoibacter tsumagoiensis]GCE10856.1 hypothetical protein KTT_07150 [Tengunoibacter tsumagoiensis]